jgi:replication fork protection complex subunit Csm3/Swi3
MTSTPASDINAIFADIENDDFFRSIDNSAPDLDAIRREAAAKHTSALHEILPSSSPAREVGDGDARTRNAVNGEGEKDGEKKERKKVPKLDEARLLGANGFPQLIADTKHFTPKGKGHEVCVIYPVEHAWTDATLGGGLEETN